MILSGRDIRLQGTRAINALDVPVTAAGVVVDSIDLSEIKEASLGFATSDISSTARIRLQVSVDNLSWIDASGGPIAPGETQNGIDVTDWMFGAITVSTADGSAAYRMPVTLFGSPYTI